MRTVKITIEVEVPGGCRKVAVDSSGAVHGFSRKPWPIVGCWENYAGFQREAIIKNWEETLTEVDCDNPGTED